MTGICMIDGNISFRWNNHVIPKMSTVTEIMFPFQVLGSRGDMETKIEENTRQKISELNESVKRNSEAALRRLLEIVYDIKPELHENLQL